MKTLLALLLLIGSWTAQAATFTEMVGEHYVSAGWAENIRTPSKVKDAFTMSAASPLDLTGFYATIGYAKENAENIFQLFGGREVESVAPFLEMIVTNTQAYRDNVRAKGEASDPSICWEVGNEINNPKVSGSIHTWIGDGIPGAYNDQTTIPTYAEVWLAPAAQELRKAGACVMLGSIANAANKDALAFTAALLDYTIIGSLAPDLAGMKVRDVIHWGSIHYCAGTPTGCADAISVFGALPVDITEEVGATAALKNLGMVAAIKAIGRSLPNNKVYLWGTGLGAYTIDAYIPAIAAFFGDAQLVPVESGLSLEAYAFMAGAKKGIFVPAQNGTISGLTGPGSVFVYRTTGVEVYALPATIQLDTSSAAFVALD